MTTETLGRTAGRTTPRIAVGVLPSRPDLVDAGFGLALGLLALYGFRTSFDSPRFLLVGAIGLLLGVLIAQVATALRWNWPITLLLTLVAFFLLGGAVALTPDTLFGMPTRTSVTTLAEVSVQGWKGLLTTLPPASGDGQFLVLPYLLGLLTGALGHTLARRTARPFLPIVVFAVLFVLVTALGTLEPAHLLLAMVFGAVAFLWAAVRRRRVLRIVGTGTSRRSQLVVSGALLAVALGGGWVLGGHLPFVDGGARDVLRTHVEPPFDVAQYPSPLVGFRKYTKDVKLVWDQTLFTVQGAPEGTRMRIAVLDDYSGTVWGAAPPGTGAGEGYRRVGETIGAPPLADGPRLTTEVTIGAAYAGLSDASLWVPGAGYPQKLTFAGPRADVLADSLRYDTTAGQAVVAERLRQGDVVRGVEIAVAETPKAFEPATDVTISGERLAFVEPSASKWGEKKPALWEQVLTIAEKMRTTGAYSDGTRAGETHHLPGHGVSRITAFLGQPQLVGNDEQYASAFALMANSLGVPARVVLGGITDAAGAVKGSDVRAWVEVLGSTGDWYAVPEKAFMPDRTKVPEQLKQPPPKNQPADQVPPPNTLRPPGALDTTFDTDPNAVVKKSPLAALTEKVPGWALIVVQIVAYPVLALLLLIALVALIRGVRRRRRAGQGSADRRLGAGWRELVDHARDLGTVVPVGLTRREQAAIVGHTDLAQRADLAVFGPGEPDDGEIKDYWSEVGRARADLTRTAKRRKRFLRLITLRSLLTRDERPVEHSLRPEPTPRGRTLRLPKVHRA